LSIRQLEEICFGLAMGLDAGFCILNPPLMVISKQAIVLVLKLRHPVGMLIDEL
jgi:hypothetical protein